jgi:hypothetical protein
MARHSKRMAKWLGIVIPTVESQLKSWLLQRKEIIGSDIDV